MSKIVVVGSLNMDMVITTNKIPVIGETVLGKGFMTAPGGKGANQAVAAAKLGGDVVMIGCVGNDIFGSEIVRSLKAANVDTTMVFAAKDVPTGVAMIVVKDGDNSIIVNSGANYEFTASLVDEVEEIIRQSDMLVVQLEIPFDTVVRAIETAKKYGRKVLLNPAPARKLNDRILKMVDIFTPNETECELITGIKINSISNAENAVKYLMDKGIPQAVITLGGKGVVYNTGKRIVHKSVVDVKVVDTTAAGDCFSGALAIALSEGKNIDEAIDFGNAAGTLTVMTKGAQTSLPSLDEVQRFMKGRLNNF